GEAQGTDDLGRTRQERDDPHARAPPSGLLIGAPATPPSGIAGIPSGPGPILAGSGAAGHLRGARPGPGGAGRVEQLPERSGAGAQRPRLVVEEMEVPDQAEAAEMEPTQASGRDLAVDGVEREERHPQPGQDRLLDRLG